VAVPPPFAGSVVAPPPPIVSCLPAPDKLQGGEAFIMAPRSDFPKGVAVPKSDMSKLVDLINDPQKRRGLKTNFDKRLKDEGIDKTKLPKGVAQAIRSMESSELNVLAKANQKLTRAGVENRHKANLV
jgi:hypothetical protein